MDTKITEDHGYRIGGEILTNYTLEINRVYSGPHKKTCVGVAHVYSGDHKAVVPFRSNMARLPYIDIPEAVVYEKKPHITNMIKDHIIGRMQSLGIKEIIKKDHGGVIDGKYYNAGGDSVAGGMFSGSLSVPDVPIEKKEIIKAINGAAGSHLQTVTGPMIFWCFGILANRFSGTYDRVPILFSFGRHETGKTTINGKIIGNFFRDNTILSVANAGKRDFDEIYNSMSRTNLEPLLLDEFKYGLGSRSLRNAVSGLVRTAYDNENVYSGKFPRRLIRPLAIMGESDFGSEPAISDRIIPIMFKDFYESHTKAMESTDWSKLGDVCEATIKMLERDGWNWIKHDPETNGGIRNKKGMRLLYNGAMLINHLCGTEVIDEKKFGDTISVSGFVCTDAVDEAESILDLMEEAAMKMSKNEKIVTDKFTHFTKESVLIGITPFISMLRSEIGLSSVRELEGVFGTIGLLGRYKKRKPTSMRNCGIVFEFRKDDFMKYIDIANYPVLFPNFDTENEMPDFGDFV